MTKRLCNIYKKVAAALLALVATNTASAQVPGSALDYMLQRPRVSKVYKDKHVFDHLFIDAGGGFNVMGRKHLKLGNTAELGIGDWISPEHGFRVNIDGGQWRIDNKHVKYFDLSLDYLLNLSALASPGKYYTPKRFEFIGVAGLDYAWSRCSSVHAQGMGFHMGLRGQLAFSPITYAYVEPRAGLIADQATQMQTWHGYRPFGSVTVGLGYRLPETRPARRGVASSSFADGLFFSVLGGPAFLTNSHPSTWHDRFGGRMAASIGKWFGPYNALRITANATSINQYNSTNHIKALGVQLDYMANLHNLFGGVNPERTFWTNFVAGVSYNRSSDELRIKDNSFGIGAGLQANVRLARGLALTFEPRVDIYSKKYAPHTFSFDDRDMTAAVLAGLTYTYNDRRAAHVEDVDDIHRMSVTIVGGLANRLNNMGHGKLYAPIGRISFTRWYAPALAWRANLQGLVRGKRVTGYNFAQAVAGLDWMADLTALSCGYDRSRTLSFKTVAGFNLGIDYAKNAKHSTYFSPDVHLGGQMAVRVADNVSVVVEPQVGYEFSKRLQPAHVGRFMPSLAVGLEYSMYREGKGDKADTPSRRDFVSASVGSGLYTGNFGEMQHYSDRYTFIGEVGYGHWFDGVNGVHASISNTTAKRSYGHNQNITSLGVGYMMNMKAAATGESTENDVFQLTGIADIALVGSKHKGSDMKMGMGGKLALQAGFNVSKAVELYVEPSAVAYTKGVEAGGVKHHPLEGEARVSIGTKVHF